MGGADRNICFFNVSNKNRLRRKRKYTMALLRGIDKSVTYNYTVKTIDLEKLQRDPNVIIDVTGYTRAILDSRTGEYCQVSYIRITDDMFGSLTIGVKAENISRTEYCNLELNIKNLDGDNLRPMKVEKFENMQGKIVDYIKSRYGIELNKLGSKFKEIEVNVNIRLNNEFKQYHHLLEMIALLLPKKYKSRNIHLGEDNTIETITFANGEVEGKIYRKSKQLEKTQKLQIEEEYLRIEYTLKKSRKIEDSLNTNVVAEMQDDYIIEFLNKQIYADLIKPLEAHNKKAEKELKKVAKEMKEQGEKSWTIRFVNFAAQMRNDKTIPVLLDSEEQIKEYLKKDLKKNYNRTVKRLEKDFARVRESSYSSGSLELFNELKDKIFA